MGAGQSRQQRRTALSIKNLPQAYKNCMAKSDQLEQNYEDLKKNYDDLEKKYNGLQQHFDHLAYNDNDDLISKLPSVPHKYGGKRKRTRRKKYIKSI